VSIDGEVTIKGITKPATLSGTIVGPTIDHFGANRVGFRLETTIDRTEFDIKWNMPLQNGEPALSNQVTLKADLDAGRTGRVMHVLAISGSLRAGSNNTALLRALREEAPEGVDVELWNGLREIPPYDGDLDIVPGPAPVEAFRELVREVDAVFFATPEIQLVRARRTQERPRLGVAPGGDELVPQ